MQEVDCFYDDVNQVYFSGIANLDYENAQAFKRFGFHELNSHYTANELDALLISKQKPISNEVRNNILNFLLNQIKVPRLKVTIEYTKTAEAGFGSTDCAIIVDTDSIWLKFKTMAISDDIIDLINKVSVLCHVFLVDQAQGFIVESSNISSLEDYLKYTE